MKSPYVLEVSLFILGLVAFAALACTSGENTNGTPRPNQAPTETSTPTPTPEPEPSPTPSPTPVPIPIPPQVSFDLDPSLTETEVDYIKSALRDGIGYAVANGLEVPTFTLTAYKDPDTLLSKRAAWEGVNPASIGENYTCDLCAAATYGAVFARISPKLSDESRFPNQVVGRSVLIHELFHVFQFLAVGKEKEYQATHTPPTQVRVYGPAWLGEGSAQWVSYRVVAAEMQLPFEKVVTILEGMTKADPVALNQMETPVGFRSGLHPWGTSLLAVEFLLKGRSPALIIEYYSAIGRGQTWQTAFAATFGISISEFYATFAEYRANLRTIDPTKPHTVSGNLTNSTGGTVSAGVSLCATLNDPSQSCWRAVISGNSFSITVPPGIYFLAANTSSGLRYYIAGGSTRDLASAAKIDLTTSDVTGLTVVVP